MIMGLIGLSSYAVWANFDDVDYDFAISERRYADALRILNNKPDDKRTIPEINLIADLTLIMDVDGLAWPRDTVALRESDVDPEIRNQVAGYLNAAYDRFLNNEKSTARLVLLQILYIYPDYPKAQHFLAKAFQLYPGSYKVVNQEDRLLKRSDNYFYGGNYLKAVEDLSVLIVLRNDNPILHEKLGSAYYMMNEKQKAIESWTTAVFFNSQNSELEELIEATTEYLAKESLQPNTVSSEATTVVMDDPQVMGVFKQQSDAFDLRKGLQEQGLTVRIDNDADGKWVVYVSQKELREKNAEKKGDK